MSLIAILQERDKKLRNLQKDVLLEAARLATLLRGKFDTVVVP